MTSKNFLVIESIYVQVKKLAPANDTSEPKNHIFLQFSYEEEDWPTHAAVTEKTTITTIDSTNNANTNSNTTSDTRPYIAWIITTKCKKKYSVWFQQLFMVRNSPALIF